MTNLFILLNWDLFILGFATAASLLLGFVVFFHNRNSITARLFLLFTVVSVFWGIANYALYQFQDAIISILMIRLVMFFAVWQAFFFYSLTLVFPDESFSFSFKYKYLLFPFTSLVSIITLLTPFVFSRIELIEYGGGIPKAVPGVGVVFFGLLAVGLVVAGIVLLVKNRMETEVKNRKTFNTFLAGVMSMFLLIIVFNFIFPVFFDNRDYIPLGAVFTLPFILFTSYSIVKHGLFNAKIISTEILVLALSIGLLLEVFLSDDILVRIFRVSLFLLVLSLGILLVKSIINEVKQKEDLQKISTQLKQANKKLKKLDEAKTEFLSITSHQLRTPLSSIKGYLSMMIEGDFGSFDKPQTEALNRVYGEVERLIRLVQVFLNVSRIESGRLRVARIAFNMHELLTDVLEQLSTLAQEKSITMTYNSDDPALEYVGDSDKLKDVFVNLVDNAIKYTPSGKIWITTEKDSTNLKVEVHDTGVGIEPEYAEHLFQKFSRAKGIAQINAGGSGLGLFIVKKIIEAHGGTIQAKSEGKGKGTTFTVLLPFVAPDETTNEATKTTT